MVLRRREAISIPAWFGNWPRQRLPVLVGSDAARTLEDAMRRYVSGEVSGRSFLLAGHRGAGTTTLVRRVAERITDEIFDHLVNLA